MHISKTGRGKVRGNGGNWGKLSSKSVSSKRAFHYKILGNSS